MFSAILITVREGLEAALLIGIVLGYLQQIGQRQHATRVWAGVGIATLLSVLMAIVMNAIGMELEEPFEQIFEGTTMLLAVAVLTWMIFWMRYQGQFIKRTLERNVQATISRGEHWGLFGLAFFAVIREGLETALFLTANVFTTDAPSTLIGALIGIALAVTLGVLIYVYTVRLNVKLFFDVTSMLLIIFAAGLITHAVHEFQEIGWLPILMDQAWNTEWLLTNGSVPGSILRALVGYNAKPSKLEVVTYLGYLLIIVQTIRWWTRRLSLQQATPRP